MTTPAQLIGPCLEKLCDAAAGRKYTKLRHEAKSMLMKLDEATRPATAPPGAPGAGGSLPLRSGLPLSQTSTPPPEPASFSHTHQPAEGEADPATSALESAVQSAVLLTDNLQGTAGLPGPQEGDGSARSTADYGESVVEAAPRLTADFADDGEGLGPGGTVEVPVFSVSGVTLEVRPGTGASVLEGMPPEAGARTAEQGEAWKGSLRLETAQELLDILRMAIDTRKVPMVDIALDLLQKLMAYQYLAGRVSSISHKRDPSAKTLGKAGAAVDDDDDDVSASDDMPPQAQAVELLCRCDDIPDEAIELRVLKGLLTAVTSSTINLHGQALLLAIRTSYNIYLMSRSEVNQTTAKASLTQMLNVVFQRMELGTETAHVPPIMVSDVLGLPSTDSSSMSAFVQSFLLDVVTTVDPFGSYVETVQQGLDLAFSARPPSVHSDPQDSPKSEGAPSGQGVGPSEKASRPADAGPGSGTGTGGTSGGATPAEAITPPPPTPPLQPGGDAGGADVLVVVEEGGEAGGPRKGRAISAILHKDAFLAFRALCKLSIRTSESMGASDLAALRGKVLALELLKILLENSGPVFRSSEKFTAAIKQYLCLSLLKNANSPAPAAQALSTSIFYTLLTKFRHSLKAEVGVFFPMLLLRAIEPPQPKPGEPVVVPPAPGSAAAAAELAQRMVVMRCLSGVCDNGQLLVDVFVNYDCDLEGANLFERMVLALVRIAQGKQFHEGPAVPSPEEHSLRQAALQCLVSILRSLVDWYLQSLEREGAGDMTEAAGPLAGVDESVRRNWDYLTSKPSSDVVEDMHAADEPGEAPDSPVGGGPRPFRRDSSVSGSAALLATDGAGREGEASAREAQMLQEWKAYKKGYQEGINLFNKKPKKGIAYMQEQGMLGRQPEEVAKFLAKTQGLNKTMIGEYLGEREEVCLKVMHAYVDAMDFGAMDFDAAIRSFLSGFRLPGEAQKIDRLMEKFAQRYVSCNAEAFKSADVAYVLAYSVIMLNTDAHNPQVKNKMSKQDFLRNNRGINDGADLAEEYLTDLYNRIVNNEIKMKDGAMEGVMAAAQAKGNAVGWMDTILNLIPGRKQQALAEPSEEAIKRTHDYLREKAKGATFFEATEGETVRPMLDVAWAPLLGAFSVLFEEFSDGVVVNQCLAGFVAAVRITSLLGMDMLRNTFVTSVARFTMLHAPASMTVKNARAFRAMLVIADENGNYLGEVWQEVLRCVSRWELLQQMASGGPTDAVLFSSAPDTSTSVKKKGLFSRVTPVTPRHHDANGKVSESFTNINDAPLNLPNRSGKSGEVVFQGPPEAVMREIDPQEINRMFVRSDRLDSSAIVDFVRALSAVASEELRPVNVPRVYSLTKIVEISHFNMTRIRLVWSRIWAVLSDFFVEVGCHKNLQVAMYAVDSLRQLAMKFLERDELANYSFQNDFLKPFVILMRQSRALEIRELIIRCVSQMVLARVANVKSGWKSMFMVFTTAANDEQPTIVRLAFETIEKIVRDHFDYITETEITTFTDCVNCLIAFTNNPHSLDVSLNAIAFLRYCAMKLAEGAIGDVEELPEGTDGHIEQNVFRIRPSAYEPDMDTSVSRRTTYDTQPEVSTADRENGHSISDSTKAAVEVPKSKGLQFSDKDEHMYFWFPLLAGLSELTFDPRPEIRYSALEVLFDTLNFHGASFTTAFWTRIFDSVLLPIFDHVRAEVTDTTTFTDEKRREEVDAWLYETCTQCLQHIIDVVATFYPTVQPLLPRIIDLLTNFIKRPHQSLAAVGVAALVRVVSQTGSRMSPAIWEDVMEHVAECAADTMPGIHELVPHLSGNSPAGHASPRAHAHAERHHASLVSGSGARRLNEARCRAAIQLLLVQACGEIYAQHAQHMPRKATEDMLNTVSTIAEHSRTIDTDVPLRLALAKAQVEDKVPEGRTLPDPPLLRLESEACSCYLSMLLHATARPNVAPQETAEVEDRLVTLCMRTIQCFEDAGAVQLQDREQGTAPAEAELLPEEGEEVSVEPKALLVSQREESSARAPLMVSILRAYAAFPDAAFRKHLRTFFPLLTRLISCENAPLEVQRALSDLFSARIGPLLTVG